MHNPFCQRRWKKRDVNDPEWNKLGYTQDSRRQRADAVERECRQFWLTIITTVVIITVTVLVEIVKRFK